MTTKLTSAWPASRQSTIYLTPVYHLPHSSLPSTSLQSTIWFYRDNDDDNLKQKFPQNLQNYDKKLAFPSALCALPQASMTNGSLTAIHAITSTPLAFRSAAFSI